MKGPDQWASNVVQKKIDFSHYNFPLITPLFSSKKTCPEDITIISKISFVEHTELCCVSFRLFWGSV